MPPPLDDYVGWLFHAFAGSASSVDLGDSTYNHYFPESTDDQAVSKYLTARRKVPATTTDLYEQMLDQVVYRLLFGFTPGEYATLRAEMIGRKPTKPDGSGWSFSAKDETSVPIVCKGEFQLPDATDVETANGITLDMTNIIPDLRRMLVAGDYYPYDFPIQGRAITVAFSHLWEDADLYASLYYSGTDWNPVIYSSSFRVMVQSPGFITGAIPYELEFKAENVDWSCQPVALRGGDLVEMAMVGTIAAAGGTGHDWWLRLRNGTANYTWLTA
jgi:hypothetical protein